MKSFRVLFLSSWYPDEQHPGSGIFVRRHAEVLARAGMEVYVLSFGTNDGNAPQIIHGQEQLKGLKEIRLELPVKNKSLPGKIFGMLKCRKFLRDFFSQIQKDFNPQLLQVNVAYPAGLFWWFFRDLMPEKIILAEHWSGYLAEDGRYRGLFQKLITQSLVHHASGIMVVSEVLKQSMIQHGLNGKYHELPNVVDSDLFPYFERKPTQPFVFIHVSSLDEFEKNPELLLKAFARLLASNPLVRLIMVGGEPERIAALKMLAVKLNIGSLVSWEGIRKPEEVAALLREAHAFVLSSNFEGQPVVLLEALSSGMPVVAPRIGGIPQIAGKEEGILYERGDEVSLMEAMKEIIQQYNRFNGSQISLRVQKKHGTKSVAAYFSSVYQQVLGNA